VARTVTVDEPVLAAAPSEADAAALKDGFRRLRSLLPNTRLILSAAPGAFARDAIPLAIRLPVDALYLDTITRPRLLVEALALLPPGLELLVPETAEEEE
jgi:5-methyltetrahydropteroyltriglutamate--homocysteine methyltransferase